MMMNKKTPPRPMPNASIPREQLPKYNRADKAAVFFLILAIISLLAMFGHAVYEQFVDNQPKVVSPYKNSTKQ